MSVANATRTAPSGTVLMAVSRDDVRKRVLARLLERHDPAKAKHKPPMLLRAELRRSIEQILEADAVATSNRERLIDEILSDYPGLGPLDELFRDETCKEFLVLAHNQVIRRSEGGWLPTSVQFHDREHLRQTLKKLFATASPIGAAPTTSDGGADALLPNGFRVIAILPPRVMEQSALAVFRREDATAADVTPATDPALSALLRNGNTPTPTLPLVKQSGTWDRSKQRITENFVQRLAANGVKDLSSLPRPQLRKVIAAFVLEFNGTDHLHLDATAQERMTLEILAGMHS